MQIFGRLVGDEESHFDQFEKQSDNLKRFGLNYLALQSIGMAAPESAQSAMDLSSSTFDIPRNH